MIYWAPLLHFYQPPSQMHWILNKVCNESYRPLVNLFHDLPYAKVTVNINAVLTEMLINHGMTDVIRGLQELAEEGRLEFTGSGKYHPILPLIPQHEVARQIAQNYQTNRQIFGSSYSPQGFFPPEMGYSHDIVKPILNAGYNWIIISGIACPVSWPVDIIHAISTADSKKLAVFFRDDILSNRISFKQTDAKSFIDQLKGLQEKKKNIYIVTAMDAETFGHHIKSWEQLFLAEVYDAIGSENSYKQATNQLVEKTSHKPHQLVKPAAMANAHSKLLQTTEVAETNEIRVVTISELLELFPAGEPVEPRPSSWSTSMDDIKAENPYPLWKSKDNIIHKMQWQHLKIAIELTNKALETSSNEASKEYAEIARELLDRALHSDQFWWASHKPMWDVNMINRGLMQQREVVFTAYKAINLSDLTEDEKMEFYYRVIASRDLRSKITDQLFVWS